jgi:hypothetical protein
LFLIHMSAQCSPAEARCSLKFAERLTQIRAPKFARPSEAGGPGGAGFNSRKSGVIQRFTPKTAMKTIRRLECQDEEMAEMKRQLAEAKAAGFIAPTPPGPGGTAAAAAAVAEAAEAAAAGLAVNLLDQMNEARSSLAAFPLSSPASALAPAPVSTLGLAPPPPPPPPPWPRRPPPPSPRPEGRT